MSTRKLQPHYFLCEWYGSAAGKVFDLKGAKMQLGRNREADIQILRSNVSRNHCTFQRCPRGWAIKDNGSQNGTYVNDEKVTKARLLKKGDRIHFGPPTLVSQGYIFGVRLPHEEYRILHPVEMPWIYKKETHLPTTNNSRASEDHHPVISGECSRPVINSPASVTSKRKSENKRNTLSKKRKLTTDSENFSSGEPAVSNQQNSFPSVKDLIKIPGAVVDQIETIINVSGVSKQIKKAWSPDMLEKYGPFIQTLDPVLPDSKPDGSKKNENTCEEENSESLLDVSILDEDPYPFSQRLDDDSKSSKLECLEYENTHPRSCAPCHQGQISTKIEGKDKINADDETEKKLKELLLENEKLREKLAEEKKLIEEIAVNKQDAKKEVATEILGKLEEELMCNICTEMLIKPVVLDCSHTFCEFCICEWKKKKKQCPICRNRIKSETTVLALERLIEKSVESLSPNAKAKRNEIIEAREQQQDKHAEYRRELRSRGRIRRRVQSPVRDVGGHRIGFRIGGLEILDDDDDDDLSDMIIVNEVEDDDLVSITDSDASDSDASVEGIGYYPGYGRCFNCGRRGHWANGCPEC